MNELEQFETHAFLPYGLMTPAAFWVYAIRLAALWRYALWFSAFRTTA